MNEKHHRPLNKQNPAINDAQELTAFLGGKWTGTSGQACCPGHDDGTPSLNISDGDKNIVVRCFAGCEQEKIIRKLRERGVDLSLVRNSRRARKVVNLSSYELTREVCSKIRNGCLPVQGTVVETYLETRGINTPENLYQTEDGSGNPQMLSVMFSSVDNEVVGWQTTTLKRDGSAKVGNPPRHFMKGMKTDAAYTPFGDEEGATVLCIAEGIETALSVQRLTRSPTWAAYSAGNLPKLSIPHQYKEVIIAADNDANGTGLKNAKKLANRLTEQGRTVRIAMPRTTGFDWNDILKKRGTTMSLRRKLRQIIFNAPVFEGEPYEFLSISEIDFSRIEMPERKTVLGNWLTESSLTMVHASTGVGKSLFVLGIAYTIATGDDFLGWEAAAPQTVLYVDGEMPVQLLKKRQRWFQSAYQGTHNLRVISLSYRSKLGKPRLDLCKEEHRTFIDQEVENTKTSLLILDNLSCLAPGGENEAELWEPVNSWLMSLRDRGLAVILVHHDGKDSSRGQRGQIRKLDQFDNDVQLRRPSGYEQSNGCEFVFRFGDKARDVHGDEARSFTARMEIVDDVMTWSRSDDTRVAEATKKAARDKEAREMWKMRQSGNTLQAIADHFNTNRMDVKRRVDRYATTQKKSHQKPCNSPCYTQREKANGI